MKNDVVGPMRVCCDRDKDYGRYGLGGARRDWSLKYDGSCTNFGGIGWRADEAGYINTRSVLQVSMLPPDFLR